VSTHVHSIVYIPCWRTRLMDEWFGQTNKECRYRALLEGRKLNTWSWDDNGKKSSWRNGFWGSDLNGSLFIRGVKSSSASGVSSVSIVSDYGLDDRTIGLRSPGGAKDFSSILCVQTGSGAHPASCTMGNGGTFPGGKARPGRDTDHSPPSSAEVENE
jgi:hypothetical protein